MERKRDGEKMGSVEREPVRFKPGPTRIVEREPVRFKPGPTRIVEREPVRFKPVKRDDSE